MASKPNGDSRIFASSADEEICITGFSGSFPSSRNVAEFEHHLWNKIDMVSDQHARWPHYHPEIPKRMGNIHDIDRFDAQFFGVHYKQADLIDPQGRILQERAYEAVTDAGVHPRTLRGSRTGVFIGACYAESEKTIFYEKSTERGFGITGCSRAMMANRISYSLGLHGPSFLLDTACSSSMYALDQAFSHMRSGQCDAAIVGGVNLLLRPEISIQFARLGAVSKDGFCRPFDTDASGYVRAEGVATLFLQKAKDAKRIYAKVIYTKTNCDGYKQQGITYPSGLVQQKLLTEFYADLQLDAGQVEYVEAHGTGTVVGDPEECFAIANVFCKNRTTPLLVGSVKSNMGHAESSSAVCSIAKVILAFEKSEMPPNIHFVANRSDIPSLVQKQIMVCAEVTKLTDSALVGINSFGIGGANAHALLQGNMRTKLNNGRPEDDIPRLVNWSGRTQETISVMLDYLRSHPLDAEYIGLLQSIQSVEESSFLNRGFGVFANGTTNDAPAICLHSGEQRYEGVKRPMVWIFSGMGSQWPEMGASLMDIPLFKESIAKSHAILQPFGIDLIRLLTDSDKEVFENILNSFVGIASIQVALVDVLSALDITPDYLVGHSVGELGCAYADGVLNQEQMIMSAYYRGVASRGAKVIRGSMAAVGIGHCRIKAMLPDDIEVACHNSVESTTISGPAESITKFVAKLTSQNIFAREVRCSNIAYHSRYVSDVGVKLLELSKDLYSPIRRSDKWLSTSVPQNEWNEPTNRISNAQYYANNLLNSVLFEETTALLPSNAIAIEIAPHGLLQAIVKRSMPNTTHIALTQRGSANNAAFFLGALGKLYMNGWTMPLEKLYPPINYPVSRGTAKISPLLRWDHSVPLFVSKFELSNTVGSGERRVKINLANEDYAYITGHTVDGRCLFPATGYLEMVWVTLAMMKGVEQMLLNVEFEDIHFLRATALQPDTDVELTVMIHYGNGSFEVSEGSTSIVTGVVREVNDVDAVLTELPPLESSSQPMLNKEDFYKELLLHGYEYQEAFQSVRQVRSDGIYAQIQWQRNWVTFLDGILQTTLLTKDTRSLMLPTRIRKIRIFPKDHDARSIVLPDQHKGFEVQINNELDIVQAGAVEICGMVTSTVARRKAAGELILESYKFVPHNPTPLWTQREAFRFCIQLLVENHPTLTNVKVVNIIMSSSDGNLSSVLQELFDEIPSITHSMTVLTDQEEVDQNKHTNSHVIIFSHTLDTALLETSHQSLVNQGFVIVNQPLTENVDWLPALGFNLIARIPTETDTIFLLRRKEINQIGLVINISKSNDFDWLPKVQNAMKTQSILLVAQNDQCSGIIGLVNCIRREPDIKHVSCVFIDDETAPPFEVTNRFYADQLSLNLAFNVYRHGSWGSYRHQQLVPEQELKPRSGYYFANLLRPGDLSSFNWLEGSLLRSTTNDVVRIQYAAINFKDVMLATGRLSADSWCLSRIEKECLFGIEYAGCTQSGQKVMGIVSSGALGTLIVPQPALTWNVPSTWSLQEAATVPVVYGTVYTALFMDNVISAGKSILIHAGSGGVGLAAIRVALAYGMEVFTTVSSMAKKKFILDLFPKLKESNIGNSRDCTFERLIKLRTRGKGVDYVLNCLSDEKLQASIRCLGRGGVFLEIGKFDMSNDTKIGLGVFLKEISFRSVMVDNLLLQTIENTRHIHGLIERDLETGIIQPLSSTVFQMDEIEQAYRFMSTGQHVGKVLIQVRQDVTDELTLPIRSLPRAYFDADKVYIIPGGLGGFGLELADWMVLRGARTLVLSSRRGVSSAYQMHRIRVWKNYGCRTIISTADISTVSGCRALIDEAQQYGPIDGIFNLAVCLHDAILANQTSQSFLESAAPKSEATIHLDAIARKCLNLRYFVVFSSVACGRGNAGQSNYGMANSVMERIVEQRVSDGLCGKAIQWGAVGEVGLGAALTGNDIAAEIGGTRLQRIASCLGVMDTLLTTSDAIVASMVVAKKQEPTGLGKNATLIDRVLNIMSIKNRQLISMTTSLAELGLDSLTTIEIRQCLERDFDMYVSTPELRAMTFQTLQQLSDGGAQLVVAASDTDSLENYILNFTNLMINEQYHNYETIYRLFSQTDPTSSFVASVLIMPGLEGDTNPAWRLLCKQINGPTFIGKYRATWNAETVVEMAEIYAQLYLETIGPHKKFFVIGYSFGTLVAIEIVRILEATGLCGHLVCVDGAPAFVKKLLLKLMQCDQLRQQQLENTILQNIALKYLPHSNLDTFNDHLDALESWHTKLRALLTLLTTAKCNVDETFLAESITGFYHRTMFSYFYPVTDKIRCDITLVRAKQAAISDIDEMYELRALTEGTVGVRYVDGNHQTVLESFAMVTIVNGLLMELD